MSVSTVVYAGDGMTYEYVVPFPFINRSHVEVTINLVPMVAGVDYDWQTDGLIRFFQVPPNEAGIVIRRNTPITSRLVEFQNGAVLTEEELNLAVKQLFYRLQETDDYYTTILEGGLAAVVGGTATNAQDMIDAAVQQVLQDPLLANLAAVQSDIDANAEAILTHSSVINQLAQELAATVFVQATEPVPGVGGVPNPIPEGSRWYDSDDSNKPYIYLSGAWQSLEDPRIAANAADILALESTVNNPTTGVAATASALDLVETLVYSGTEGNVAIAGRTTALESTVNNPTTGVAATASALDTVETLVNHATWGNTALSNRTTTLESTVNNPTTGVAATASALDSVETLVYSGVNGNVALASSLTSLTTTVDGHTTTISTQASSINGLEAQYTVKVDNNGRVTGFGFASTLNNGVPESSFIVIADKFAIVDPANTAAAPKVPFVVTGGVVYMQNVVIQDALIQNLQVGKLTSGTFPNGQTFTHSGDFNVGTTGRVRGGKTGYNNGSTGFYLGYASGQYVLEIGDTDRFLRWDGGILTISKLQVLDGFLNNTPLGPSSARVVTSGSGHSAPLNTYDMASFDTTVSQAIYVQVGPFLAPDEGAGYNRKRVAFRKSDFTIQCNYSCNTNTVDCYVQYRYKTGGVWGAWVTLTTVSVKGDNRGSAHAFLRFTSTDATSWQEIEFRTYTANSNAFAAAMRVDCLNAEKSANTAGSVGYLNGAGTAASPATSVLGSAPTPPAWTPDPTWNYDKYLVAP